MSEVTVLIIDTDEANSQFMAQLLRKRGYHAFVASSGKDGLQRAQDHLPGVIIYDTALTDLNFKEFINAIQKDRRVLAIPLIAVSARYDAAEMERCLEAGYAEYFAKSGIAALALVDAIPRLITESASKVHKDDKGSLCVFLSAKGGVGTSSVCANIAQNLVVEFPQSSTGVADLVLPMGSISSIVGYQEDVNLGRITEKQPEDITADLLRNTLPVPQGWGFHLLPGSPDPHVAARLTAEHIPEVIKAMQATFQYVVIDIGRMLSRIVLPIIQEAEIVALVMGTDLSSLGLTKKLWEYLQTQGVTADHMYPILNRAVGLQGLTKAEAERALGLEIKVTIPYMMENFSLANNLHVPITTKYPTDTASMVLKQTAADISHRAIKIRAGDI